MSQSNLQNVQIPTIFTPPRFDKESHLSLVSDRVDTDAEECTQSPEGSRYKVWTSIGNVSARSRRMGIFSSPDVSPSRTTSHGEAPSSPTMMSLSSPANTARGSSVVGMKRKVHGSDDDDDDDDLPPILLSPGEVYTDGEDDLERELPSNNVD
ncbi:hypothetical protein FRB99_000685, partial [Tulasnella sp. 403]